jgi:TetR/AcrR family transcriptional repressor of nem operon
MEQATHGKRRSDARTALLDAALRLVREKGFAGTSVDELCAAAGVTKGAFFHHFKTKEALGVAAADHWSQVTGQLFAQAPYHHHADPLDRVLGYLNFREQLIAGAPAEFTCLVGTMTQEIYLTSSAIREASFASIAGHASTLEADISATIARYGAPAGITAESLALHTQAVLQGAFILAKGKDDPALARDSIDHLRRYLTLLFPRSTPKETKS